MMKDFVEFLYSKFLQSDGISIDSRTVEPGNLFFALKGPNFNANMYARQAIEKGAAFAVVDDEEYAEEDHRIILAEDSLKALQDLAVFHRKRYKRTLIAITGSNGKTTTKELLTRVLSKKYITHATKGNFNNHIGVPLTLLDIYPQIEVAIIEMGANHVGEISQLCDFADPNYGLITNIGEAHTETFGGIEGVLRGKSELFDHLRKNGGTPFINLNDDRLSNMAKRFKEPILFPEADLELVSAAPFLKIRLANRTVDTHLIGRYNYGNIAAAISVGRAFDVSDSDILEAVSSYTPDNQRSQIIEKGNIRIINDSYNANPTSMRAALKTLDESDGTKIAILGEMKEVENSREAHLGLGDFISTLHLDEVLFLGADMQFASERVTGSRWFSTFDELKSYLDSNHLANATILLKASRSIKLEEAIDHVN